MINCSQDDFDIGADDAVANVAVKDRPEVQVRTLWGVTAERKRFDTRKPLCLRILVPVCLAIGF